MKILDFLQKKFILERGNAHFRPFNFADFGAVFRFCKHASDEKVNAKFFCGVDFFQPPKGF